MSSRPYIQKTIINLQELFEASRDNPAELKKLATELSHRKVPKAVALTKKVSDALKGAPSKFDDGSVPANPLIGSGQKVLIKGLHPP